MCFSVLRYPSPYQLVLPTASLCSLTLFISLFPSLSLTVFFFFANVCSPKSLEFSTLSQLVWEVHPTNLFPSPLALRPSTPWSVPTLDHVMGKRAPRELSLDHCVGLLSLHCDLSPTLAYVLVLKAGYIPKKQLLQKAQLHPKFMKSYFHSTFVPYLFFSSTCQINFYPLRAAWKWETPTLYPLLGNRRGSWMCVFVCIEHLLSCFTVIDLTYLTHPFRVRWFTVEWDEFWWGDAT